MGKIILFNVKFLLSEEEPTNYNCVDLALHSPRVARDVIMEGGDDLVCNNSRAKEAP